MKLTLSAPHISIKKIDDVEINDFTVLTGLNGAGKTHLLEAMKEGKCRVDQISKTAVRYENYSSFSVNNPGQAKPEQIFSMKHDAWLKFTTNNSNFCPVDTARILYKKHFIKKDGEESIDIWSMSNLLPENIWDIDKSENYDQELISAIEKYKVEIENSLFKNEKFTRLQNSKAIRDATKKAGVPLHNIIRDDFFYHFSPSARSENYLAESLSEIFVNHMTVRSSWVHAKFGKNSDQKFSKSELEEEYDTNHLKPWDKLNKIITEIHLSSSNKTIFDFSISAPPNLPDDPYAINLYNFSPSLIKNSTGQQIAFDSLSSGEKILFSLAISVFQSKENSQFPELMLLDEIDAPLHPSMTRALIQTIKSAFIDNGVKVIMTTHSPSTIALSPDESIFVLRSKSEAHTIEKQTRKEAMDLISEGFSTLDQGISIFNDEIQDGINIMTEGNNAKIIKRALELHGHGDVYVIPKFEGKTGQDQLATIFDFFCLTDHKQPLLFVLDTDANKNRQDSGLNFWLKLPRNEENLYTQKGIENIFPSEYLEEFLYSIIKGGVEKRLFDGDKKAEFSNYIIQQGKGVFSVFQPLFEKIDQIKAAYRPNSA